MPRTVPYGDQPPSDQAKIKSLPQNSLVQIAVDEHQLRAASPVAPRPERVGIDRHMHPLDDDSLITALETQESLHSVETSPVGLQGLSEPRLKAFGVERAIRLDAEGGDALVVGMPRIEIVLH